MELEIQISKETYKKLCALQFEKGFSTLDEVIIFLVNEYDKKRRYTK